MGFSIFRNKGSLINHDSNDVNKEISKKIPNNANYSNAAVLINDKYYYYIIEGCILTIW